MTTTTTTPTTHPAALAAAEELYGNLFALANSKCDICGDPRIQRGSWRENYYDITTKAALVEAIAHIITRHFATRERRLREAIRNMTDMCHDLRQDLTQNRYTTTQRIGLMQSAALLGDAALTD